VLLLGLAAVWGASFMFIKVADRRFAPMTVVWLRLVLATAVLVPAAVAAAGPQAFEHARRQGRRLLAVGVVNSLVPFALIAWAETRIDSGLAAILQAAAPIFSVVIASRFDDDRVTPARLLGVTVGLVGVALVVGVHLRGGHTAALAVILAALFYATGGVYAGRALRTIDPVVAAAGSLACAAVVAAPFGLAQLPASVPGWKETGSVLVLGIAGTGVAYGLYFALIREAGPARSILVTYLVPPVALAYGVLLLGEPFRTAAVVGLALILIGVALAGGSLAMLERTARSRGDRDVTWKRGDELQPASDRGVRGEVEAAFVGDVGVCEEGDVCE